MQLQQLPYYSKWPVIQSSIVKDPAIETEIERILSLMTVAEKVGQMIQPELREVTVEEIQHYKIGSILNGGGAWPNHNKYASAAEWAAKADEFWHATEAMFADRPFRIPFFWGTDAVHGHNNVYRATVFPHNIGLGCARNPALLYEIGRITAKEIAATGLDWTFAPTVATPRDLRWGRVYEGYSEDPEITYAYAGEMVRGLQGSAEELKGQEHVISNVKHWLGDGGTATGVDRGINHYSEDHLRNIHAMGYFSGLNAGAQVVMSSFNSWVNEANYDHSPELVGEYNYKIHGSKYLLTDVLKQRMGFDGLVVTDWHGHAEVSKCSDGNASYAINAGNDILMIPVREHWQAVYQQTLADIECGVISMSRIDDAVRRILRVKMRADLWHKPAPSQRKLGGDQAVLGAEAHREIARSAVRQSLVLLKNKNQILPLQRNQKIILTGSAANDLQKQCGGWSLTWQGDENLLTDFPGATTLKMALEAELGAENVVYDPDLSGELIAGDTAIVVFGEDPYAEMMGDIKAWQSLEYATLKRSYMADTQKIRQLYEKGVRVISIFFSGRPLFVNEEISLSDAFVAAFLPGSEGEGITDVLLADAKGKPQYDFVGKLSYSWPNRKRSTTVSRIPPHIPNYKVPAFEQSPLGEHTPLFEYGYGLNYSDTLQDRNLDKLNLDIEESVQSTTQATHPEHIYGVLSTIGNYQLRMADSAHWMGVDVSRNNVAALSTIATKPYNYQQQQDAVELTFLDGGGQVYIQTGSGQAEDFSRYNYPSATINFEVKVLEAAQKPVFLALQRTMNAELVRIEVTPYLQQVNDQFVKVSIPCALFAEQGQHFSYIDTPFLLESEGAMHFVLANICWNVA